MIEELKYKGQPVPRGWRVIGETPDGVRLIEPIASGKEIDADAIAKLERIAGRYKPGAWRDSPRPTGRRTFPFINTGI